MFRPFAVPVLGKMESQGGVETCQPVYVLRSNDNQAQHKSIHPFDVDREMGTSASSKCARTSSFPPSALIVAANVLSLTSPRFSNREMAGCFTPAFFASVTWECPYNSRISFNPKR